MVTLKTKLSKVAIENYLIVKNISLKLLIDHFRDPAIVDQFERASRKKDENEKSKKEREERDEI